MSVEDLAIDVGIPVNTEEFDTFVSCVENILDHGCGYSADVTVQICERCETSELPVAKRVLRECRRAASNTSRMRPSKLKWWQTWRSKREGQDVPRWPGRAASPSPVAETRPRTGRREMALEFKKNAHRNRRPRPNRPPAKKARYTRPESPVRRPMDQQRRRKRPMSPMFESRYSPQYERHTANTYSSRNQDAVSQRYAPKKRRRR